MIRAVARTAYALDEWLHRRLGRGYRILLTVGLIADIGHRIFEAAHYVESKHHLTGIVLAVILELGLLVHQVGELHHRMGGARQAEE